jgi:NAD(P)-dependent dehydrogenase (short-subunit alcohol dehydrogenase family)
MNPTSCLIAGGSSGLGAACVRRLVERGAGCVIADLQPPEEALLRDVGDRGVFCLTDVTDESAVRAALLTVQQRFGPVQAVVICAGIIRGERILGSNGPFDLDLFRRVVDVNLVGTFNVLRLAAECLRDNAPNADGERGVIITTSSVAAFEGQIGQAAYAASKGGVASLTLPAARELGRFGIRVVSIAPGVFETPMVQQLPEKVRQSLEAQTVFPSRLGRPDEFASLVLHILDNPMLNGDVVRLDGGMRMGAK